MCVVEKWKNWQPSWRAFAFVISLYLAPFALWLAVDSSILIRVHSFGISGSEVTVERSFPMADTFGFERPMVRYHETVRPLPEGLPVCEDGAKRRYSAAKIIAYDIAEWATPCMIAPYVLRAEWTGYLFDFIPLRTISREVIVIEPLALDCPYRVSTSGIIHGPDSPYAAMVPPSRCYQTRQAARAALGDE